jgi:hypothetical protein
LVAAAAAHHAVRQRLFRPGENHPDHLKLHSLFKRLPNVHCHTAASISAAGKLPPLFLLSWSTVDGSLHDPFSSVSRSKRKLTLWRSS